MKAFILTLLIVSTMSLADKEKQAVIRNKSFIVMCDLILPEGSSYVWSLNGRPFDLAQFSVTNQSTQGRILGQSIKKTNAVDGDNGTYTCQVDQNSVSSLVLVTDEPEITILGPEHKYAYVDKDKTIQVHVDYQGGDVSLNLINSTKDPVPGTVQHKTVFGNETFNITLSNVKKLREDDSYVALLRGSNLIRNSKITRFYSRPFSLTIKRKPPTPRLSVLKKGPGYVDFKLMNPSAEPSQHYDTVKNFNVTFSTMWGQTDEKVLNASVSQFRLNFLYQFTLYNATVTAHGSETQSDPSFQNFSTTFDPDKPVGFFVIPKTQDVGSNASGPIFPVCDEHQSLGNCTTAIKEIRNVSVTSPDWCYLLDFNRTWASREEWVVVSEGLPYFKVVSCSLCHPLKACPVGGANDNENWVGILVGVLVSAVSIVVIAVAVWLFLCKSKHQSRDYTTSKINKEEAESVNNPSYLSTEEAEAVSDDSTKTCQSASTKKSAEFGIEEDGTDESEVNLSEGHILTTTAIPSDSPEKLENSQISFKLPNETSEESKDESSAGCSKTPDLASSSDTVRAVQEKGASATDDTHYLDQPPTRRELQLVMGQIQGTATETNQLVLDLLKKKETSES